MEKTSDSRFEDGLDRGERLRKNEETLLTQQNIPELILRSGNPCPLNAVALR
jgi:hypothetical protein